MPNENEEVQTTETTNIDSPPGETPNTEKPAKKRRGFAVMDPKRVSEIAAKGGKAAHAAGTAHEFTVEEARAAGRLGGFATHAKRNAAKGNGNGS